MHKEILKIAFLKTQISLLHTFKSPMQVSGSSLDINLIVCVFFCM